jgi:hypothetical protein
MATMTAQILVGSSHQYHGGITPSHYLFLSENDRPAWIMVKQNIFTGKTATGSRIVWIPTVENMLEDGLLMIAIHACKIKPVVDLVGEFRSKVRPIRFQMYDDFSAAQRVELYETCRENLTSPKMIVTVFKGSSIAHQLPVLRHYKFELEICMS